MAPDHIAPPSPSDIYRLGSRQYSCRTWDTRYPLGMLRAPPPETTIAHKRCEPIPLIALSLTPPVDVIPTSASVPRITTKFHVLMMSSDQIAPKSPAKLILDKKTHKIVIFFHFHSLFSQDCCMQNYV